MTHRATREASLEAALRREVRRRWGGYLIKLAVRGEAGWPDRVLVLPPGVAVFVELKRPGEEPTRLQRHAHARLRDLGHDVRVLDDLITAIEEIRQILLYAKK